MDLRKAVASQYHSTLKMLDQILDQYLVQAIELCPEPDFLCAVP
jgi:hypothetical protein